MGRQSGSDANSKASSSIALLQERFRQLQKVKERREEKELMRILSKRERMSPGPSPRINPSNLRIQSHMDFPPTNISPTTTHQDQSLSLGLDLQPKQSDLCGVTTTQPTTSHSTWHNGASSASSSKNFDNPDIDTSLHM